jgi:hypothetical protein
MRASSSNGYTHHYECGEALRPVADGEYPFAEGQVWAEPSEADIVQKMQALRAAPPARDWLARRAATFSSRYSAAVTGAAFADRLNRLAGMAMDHHFDKASSR